MYNDNYNKEVTNEVITNIEAIKDILYRVNNDIGNTYDYNINNKKITITITFNK